MARSANPLETLPTLTSERRRRLYEVERQAGAQRKGAPMPEINSLEQPDSPKMSDSYAMLGLKPGASMRDIETAYWQFARELRGQPAMAQYTAAYEALASRITPRANDARLLPAAQPANAKKQITLVASPSKLGWPAN